MAAAPSEQRRRSHRLVPATATIVTGRGTTIEHLAPTPTIQVTASGTFSIATTPTTWVVRSRDVENLLMMTRGWRQPRR